MGWQQVDPAAARVGWLKSELVRLNSGDPTLTQPEILQRVERIEALLDAADVAEVDADRRKVLETRLVDRMCRAELGDLDAVKDADELAGTLGVEIAIGADAVNEKGTP